MTDPAREGKKAMASCDDLGGGGVGGGAVQTMTRTLTAEQMAQLEKLLTVEQRQIARAVDCMRAIDFLRADEGDDVTILCDNPDFNGQPNNAVECCGAWTRWGDRRFTGDTLEDALHVAATAKRAALQLDANASLAGGEGSSGGRAEPGSTGAGWQDIATAPRDGTVFLGFKPGWDYPMPCAWERPSEDDGSHSGAPNAWVYADWLQHDSDWDGIELTHWQPLPEPPADAPRATPEGGAS